MQKLVLIACAAVMVGLMQVKESNSCPNQALIKQFSPTAFLGVWYEFGRSSGVQQMFQGCVRDVLTSGGTSVIDVTTTYRSFFATRTSYSQLKPAVPGSTNSNYSVSYDDGGFVGRENEVTPADYQILATDYTTYAIVWRCSTFVVNFHYVRVLTRDPEPSEVVTDNIRTQMRRRDLSWFFLTRTNQNCYS